MSRPEQDKTEIYFLILKALDQLSCVARKPVFGGGGGGGGGGANNTGADQPAHPRNLISAFVVRFLSSIKCKLATGKISFF